MWFLFLLAIFSTLAQILFVTLAIAAGLYYLAELVEEYTSLTCKVIRYLIWINIGIQAGLWLFESFPATMLLVNLIHQFSNLSILKTFPYFFVMSPSFITSIVSLGLNHYLAFSHFGMKFYPFMEILAYFTICLWIVPFAFFISLSANEYVLPTTSGRSTVMNNDDDLVSHYFSHNKKRYGLLHLFNYLKESVWSSQSGKQY